MAPKKRTRLSADESKERIVNAATELIALNGFLDTSFQKIADRCKLSQSAVMHHFRTRQALLEAVVDQLIKHNHELVAGAMKADDDARTRLMKHFAGNLKWAQQYEHEGQMLLFLYYSAACDARFSRIYSDIVKKARLRIQEHLLAGIREKIFPEGMDTELVAEQLHDLLLGSSVNHLAVGKSGTKQKPPEKKWKSLIQLYEVTGR